MTELPFLKKKKKLFVLIWGKMSFYRSLDHCRNDC